MMQAVIRENECIGCTKCIQACPYDAIIGSAKWMHTVIATECTGCELCVAPCPVDCIDIVPKKPEQISTQDYHLDRFSRREERLERQKEEKNTVINVNKQEYIQQAVLRARSRKKPQAGSQTFTNS